MSDKKNKTKLTLVSNNTENKNKTKNNKVMGSDLTEKMRGFCHDVVGRNGEKGMSLIDAYRNNYNVSKDIKPNTLRMLASRLRSKDNIGIFINQLIKDKENRNKMSEHTKQELIIRKLEEFMNNEEFSDTARVRSAELIGKSLSMFTNVTEIKESDKSSVEVEQQLREKLSKLLKE